MKSSANSSSTRYWRFTFAVAMAVGLLAGCSVLTSPKEQPVIEDKVGGSIRTLSVTAERRAIIFGAKSDLRKGDQICAEPSPDIAESLVSSLKVIAEATAKKRGCRYQREPRNQQDAGHRHRHTLHALAGRSVLSGQHICLVPGTHEWIA